MFFGPVSNIDDKWSFLSLLFQNIERILHSMDIDDDFALPVLKKKLKGGKGQYPDKK